MDADNFDEAVFFVPSVFKDVFGMPSVLSTVASAKAEALAKNGENGSAGSKSGQLHIHIHPRWPRG